MLGLVTILGRYIPNLSARTAPLRQLLEKDIDWQWHSEQESAWNGIKEILSKHPVLQYYDESKALKVSSDASKDGIGAVLLQETNGEWMPVAYASRSMTKAEKNYATIEKEQLAALNISTGPLALHTFQTAGPVRASTLYLSLALQDHRVKCRASRLKITVARSMTNFATFSCILFLKLCYVCIA